MFILFIPVKVTGQNCYHYQLSRFSFLFRFQTNQKIWNKKKKQIRYKSLYEKIPERSDASAHAPTHAHLHLYLMTKRRMRRADCLVRGVYGDHYWLAVLNCYCEVMMSLHQCCNTPLIIASSVNVRQPPLTSFWTVLVQQHSSASPDAGRALLADTPTQLEGRSPQRAGAALYLRGFLHSPPKTGQSATPKSQWLQASWGRPCPSWAPPGPDKCRATWCPVRERDAGRRDGGLVKRMRSEGKRKKMNRRRVPLQRPAEGLQGGIVYSWPGVGC